MDNRWKKSVLFCRSVVDKITFAKAVSNEKRKEKVLQTLLNAPMLLTFSIGGGGFSGGGAFGLKNSTKLKKARCDQTKGVQERG